MKEWGFLIVMFIIGVVAGASGRIVNQYERRFIAIEQHLAAQNEREMAMMITITDPATNRLKQDKIVVMKPRWGER